MHAVQMFKISSFNRSFKVTVLAAEHFADTVRFVQVNFEILQTSQIWRFANGAN